MWRVVVVVVVVLAACGDERGAYLFDRKTLETASVVAVSARYGFRIAVEPGVSADAVADEIDGHWDAFAACERAEYGNVIAVDVVTRLRYYVLPEPYTCRLGACGGDYTPEWIVMIAGTSQDPLPTLNHEWRHAYAFCTDCAPFYMATGPEEPDACT